MIDKVSIAALDNFFSTVFCSDINPDKLNSLSTKHKLKVLKNDDLFSMSVDILSPCALGSVINSNNIKKLKCKIIAGAANNQLEDDKIHDKELKENRITFVPDFLINAGGIISVYHEQIQNLDKEKVFEMTEGIYSKVTEVLTLSEKNNISTNESAMQIAQDRIIRKKKSS